MKLRVLCVDDDPAILVVLEASLATVGEHDVVTAISGDVALSKYVSKGEKFDCFVLDIQMPGISGIDLCREIRQRPEYDLTPILMLTAMSDAKYIEEAFRNGATDYLSKPFDPNELNQRVEIAGMKLQPHNTTTTMEDDGTDAAFMSELSGEEIAPEAGTNEPEGTDLPKAAPIFHSSSAYVGRSELNPSAHAPIRAGVKRAETERSKLASHPKVNPADKRKESFVKTVVERQIKLETPVNLQDLKRVLSRGAFENFVDRLSVAGKKNSYIFSFAIQNIREVYDAHTDAGFERLLRKVAEQLAAILNDKSVLFAYFGNGVFCASTSQASHPFIDDIPANFAATTLAVEDPNDPVKKAGIALVMGPTSSPSMIWSPSSRVIKVVRQATKLVS